MTTALGINNPNSRYNRHLRTPEILLPITRQEEIRATSETIRAVEMLRTHLFRRGDMYGARLQAFRLGCLRRELRTLRGM